MPCDSNSCCRSQQSPSSYTTNSTNSTPTTSPLRSLLDSLFAAPRAIFDQGHQRGQEWQSNHSQHAQGHDGQSRRACSRWHDRKEGEDGPLKNDGQTAPATSAGDEAWSSFSKWAAGDGGEDGDDLLAVLKKAIERGEQRANELYRSWDPKREEDEPKDSSVQEKSLKKKVADDLKGLDSYMKEIEAEMEKTWTAFMNPPEDRYPSDRQGPNWDRFWSVRDLDSADEQLLTPYLVKSEYSPRHLEEKYGFDETWRAKFEDLVRISNGQRMLTAKEITDIKRLPIQTWMNRFKPPPQLPSNSTKPPLQQPQESPSETEYDAYSQFTRRPAHPDDDGYLQREVTKQRRLNKEWAYKHDSTSSDAGIKSVYRTVEEELQPDGSVRVKTVTRKVFGDGHEETQESETITRPEKRVEVSRGESAEERGRQVEAEGESKAKGGWFWK
jgi:hypothetical protein